MYERGGDVFYIAHDGHEGRDVLAYLRRIDVDVNDARRRGECSKRPDDAVIETDAEGDYEVGLGDGRIGIPSPVHAEHPEGKLVCFGKRAEPHEGRRNGYI